jgi:hypothetical protein
MKSGDRVYLTSGQAALYVAASGTGHLVEPLYIDANTDEEVVDEPRRVDRVHTDPPELVMAAAVAEAEARLASLHEQTTAARADLAAVQRERAEHDRLWDTLKQRAPALTTLDLILRHGDRMWLACESSVIEVAYHDSRALCVSVERTGKTTRVYVSHNDWRGLSLHATKEEAEAAMLAYAESNENAYYIAQVMQDYPHLTLSPEARARAVAYRRHRLQHTIDQYRKTAADAAGNLAKVEAVLAALEVSDGR